MALYTVVDDGYSVDVYTSQTALIRYIKNGGMLLSEPEGEVEAEAPTLAEIKKFVKGIQYVGYLYQEGFTGWKYRIEIQTAVNVGA